MRGVGGVQRWWVLALGLLGCDDGRQAVMPADAVTNAAVDAVADATADAGLDAGTLADQGVADAAVDARVADATADALLDATLEPPDAAPLPACPAFGEPVALGSVAVGEVWEASGVVESRRARDVLWLHNDSGDTARLFAVTTAGVGLGVFTLDAPRPVDWEDVAVGPGPEAGQSYLYIGDIGDNLRVRETLRVYRVAEPVVDGRDASIGGVEVFQLVYPDGPHDCETLMVDPRSGDVFLVVKSADGVSPVFRARAPLHEGANALEEVARLTFGAEPLPGGTLTTGGDISASGDAVIIRTYGSAYLWRRGPGGSVAEALATPPCRLPLAREPQGEAIGFAADGRGFFTVSEQAEQPIYFSPRR